MQPGTPSEVSLSHGDAHTWAAGFVGKGSPGLGNDLLWCMSASQWVWITVGSCVPFVDRSFYPQLTWAITLSLLTICFDNTKLLHDLEGVWFSCSIICSRRGQGTGCWTQYSGDQGNPSGFHYSWLSSQVNSVHQGCGSYALCCLGIVIGCVYVLCAQWWQCAHILAVFSFCYIIYSGQNKPIPLIIESTSHEHPSMIVWQQSWSVRSELCSAGDRFRLRCSIWS